MKPANVCWGMEHAYAAEHVRLIDLEFIGQRGDASTGFRGTPLYAGTRYLRTHCCSRGDDLDALGQMLAQWAGYQLPWEAMQIEPGNMDSYERYAAAKDIDKWASLKGAPANSFGGRLREFIAAARDLPPDATGSAPEINYKSFEAILAG